MFSGRKRIKCIEQIQLIMKCGIYFLVLLFRITTQVYKHVEMVVKDDRILAVNNLVQILFNTYTWG